MLAAGGQYEAVPLQRVTAAGRWPVGAENPSQAFHQDLGEVYGWETDVPWRYWKSVAVRPVTQFAAASGDDPVHLPRISCAIRARRSGE
jgi:hypothetical protein